LKIIISFFLFLLFPFLCLKYFCHAFFAHLSSRRFTTKKKNVCTHITNRIFRPQARKN
jgi:hypothetical protein